MNWLDPSIVSVIAFILGIVLTIVLSNFFRQLKKRNLQDNLEFLQFERDHREKLRDSKIHRDRVARRSIFSALFFLGLGLIVTLLLTFMGTVQVTNNQGLALPLIDIWIRYMPVMIWVLYSGYVFILLKRYKNINAYQKHLYKIDAKIVKARKKLDKKK